MKRILALFVALVFLSGCALSTIRPPRRTKAPARRASRPVAAREKEEVLATKAVQKEEVLPPESEEDIK
jgi:hypothetical protein